MKRSVVTLMSNGQLTIFPPHVPPRLTPRWNARAVRPKGCNVLRYNAAKDTRNHGERRTASIPRPPRLTSSARPEWTVAKARSQRPVQTLARTIHPLRHNLQTMYNNVFPADRHHDANNHQYNHNPVELVLPVVFHVRHHCRDTPAPCVKTFQSDLCAEQFKPWFKQGFHHKVTPILASRCVVALEFSLP